MSLTTPISSQVEEWRKKAQEGTLTMEEQRQIIETMRQGRVTVAAAAKSTKKKPSVNVDDMLNDLGSL